MIDPLHISRDSARNQIVIASRASIIPASPGEGWPVLGGGPRSLGGGLRSLGGERRSGRGRRERVITSFQVTVPGTFGSILFYAKSRASHTCKSLLTFLAPQGSARGGEFAGDTIFTNSFDQCGPCRTRCVAGCSPCLARGATRTLYLLHSCRVHGVTPRVNGIVTSGGRHTQCGTGTLRIRS